MTKIHKDSGYVHIVLKKEVRDRLLTFREQDHESTVDVIKRFMDKKSGAQVEVDSKVLTLTDTDRVLLESLRQRLIKSRNRRQSDLLGRLLGVES